MRNPLNFEMCRLCCLENPFCSFQRFCSGPSQRISKAHDTRCPTNLTNVSHWFHKSFKNLHKKIKNSHKNIKNIHESIKTKHKNIKHIHKNIKTMHKNIKNIQKNIKKIDMPDLII